MRFQVKPFLNRSQAERPHSADFATSKPEQSKRNLQAEIEAIETTCI